MAGMRRKAKQLKRALRRPFEWVGIWLGMIFLSNVSHKTLFKICDFLSFAMWRLDSKGRAIAHANLATVFAARPLSAKREELIVRRSYRNMARTIGHIFWTSRDALNRSRQVAELSAQCKEFLAKNKPAVTVSAHLGCWEVLSQLVYLEGNDIVSVAKDIGTHSMTELLMKSRRSLGQKIVHAEGAFRPLLQGLKDGAFVGLLVDQVVKPQNGGVWVRFFGRPHPVSAAPAFFAAKGKAPIVVAWSRPLKDGRWRCEVVDEIPASEARDIWATTQRCLGDLERVIWRHPSCWVLNYSCFRRSPTAQELAELEKRELAVRAGGEPK
jgi:KDO2-lipid IV(A) lauroyltransferase